MATSTTQSTKLNKQQSGIYEKIEEYTTRNNVLFSVDDLGFVVINENINLEDSIMQNILKLYCKIKIRPFNRAQPIIDNIIKNGFPEYITHIHFEFSIWFKKWNNIFNKLPNGLKYLVINSTNDTYVYDDDEEDEEDEEDYFQFNYSLNNLPSTLEELYIYSSCFNQPLNNLPCNIKILFLRCFDFNQSIDNLPIGLETLIIDKGNYAVHVQNINLDNLPINLKHLYIFCKKITYVKELLPPSLVKISLPDYQLELE